MTILIAGDIGGTKTILRLVEATPSQAHYFQTLQEETYASPRYADLVPMVQQFLTQTNETPDRACFAIAGPVIQQTSQLTNLNWHLDETRLQRELNLESVKLINDFAAVSYGVLGLQAQDLEPLQSVEPQPEAPIAVIGAGTGLGEGFLIPQNHRDYEVFGSEGGHTDFAPRSDLEFQLLDYIRQRKKLDRVSVERVVSGSGIITIYQYLRDWEFIPPSNTGVAATVSQWEQNLPTEQDPAKAIAETAHQKTDYLCQRTMDIFLEAYAAEVGNMALQFLPYGGLYIAGGIAAKNLSLMKQPRFMEVLKQKGRVSSILNAIPINVVVNQQVGLLGSVMYGLSESAN